MKIDDYNLTDDAKFLISTMYKEYLSRLKDNLPKRSAVFWRFRINSPTNA